MTDIGNRRNIRREMINDDGLMWHSMISDNEAYSAEAIQPDDW